MPNGTTRTVSVYGRRYECPPNLSRVDYPSNGRPYWVVKFEKRDFRFTARFYDNAHGGSAAAYHAALAAWADAAERARAAGDGTHHRIRETRAKEFRLGVCGISLTRADPANGRYPKLRVQWAGGNRRIFLLPNPEELTEQEWIKALRRAAALRLEAEAAAPSRSPWAVPYFSESQLDDLANGRWRDQITRQLQAPPVAAVRDWLLGEPRPRKFKRRSAIGHD